MPPTLEFAAPVPIIGQRFTVHEGIAMATITCKCRPDNPPIAIPHQDVIKRCPHCGHVYAITAIAFDRRKGQAAPLITVSDLGAQPIGPPPGAGPGGN